MTTSLSEVEREVEKKEKAKKDLEACIVATQEVIATETAALAAKRAEIASVQEVRKVSARLEGEMICDWANNNEKG